MENPNFLKQKYDLHNAPEVEAAAKRAEIRSGEKVPQNPADRIQNYLDRFKEITDREDPEKREHGIDALKRLLHSKFVIKPEKISKDYIKNILLGNFAEMKGYDRDKLRMPEIKEQILKMFESETHHSFESYWVPKEQNDQIADQTVQDQSASMDRWLDYLTRPEAANYPDEFRYWAFAEMLKLGAQDRDRKDFNKRVEGTAAPFPELNQQALALVLDEMGRKRKDRPSRMNLADEAKQTEFKKRLQSENFGKLYGWALDHVNSLKLPKERLPITEGEWKKFTKGSTPKELADSLQGFNTGWCIAGEGTAGSYLDHSDIWIYFSQDEDGENSIPRAAVVSDGSKVSEVRGIIQNEKVKQHLDDYIAPVVEEKLNSLPGGETWKNGMEHMKKLAEIHFKHLQKQPLDKDELIFLYELDNTIQSMGYGQDPRIKEIRDQRKPKADASIVFECASEEIAWNSEEISEKTKAYIGPWNLETFQIVKNYPNIKHLYESFPDKKIFLQTLETDSSINSPEEAEEILKNKNIYLSDYGNDLLHKTEFSQVKEKYDLVRFTVSQMGLQRGATTDEIYKKAQDFGLELCPAEVGPHLRLQYSGKEWMLIAMKQITVRGGLPSVFRLGSDGDELELYGNSAEPGHEWGDDRGFVFRFRKLET